jgi:hypothetical protein
MATPGDESLGRETWRGLRPRNLVLSTAEPDPVQGPFHQARSDLSEERYLCSPIEVSSDFAV